MTRAGLIKFLILLQQRPSRRLDYRPPAAIGFVPLNPDKKAPRKAPRRHVQRPVVSVSVFVGIEPR